MAKKQQPTTPRQRTREELVVDTFRYMIRNGDAVRREMEFINRCGGTERKVIYKVEPADSLTNEIAELIERINPKKEQ